MPDIRYYIAADGHQPFAEWFADVEAVARAKIARAIARLEQGNFSNVKSVGEGVFELRIDFGASVPIPKFARIRREHWANFGIEGTLATL